MQGQHGSGQPGIKLIDGGGGDQQAAVNADKAPVELFFQLFQRFIDKNFTTLIVSSHILLVGTEPEDVGDGDAADATVGAGADVGTALFFRYGLQPGDRALQRLMQVFTTDGFEQVFKLQGDFKHHLISRNDYFFKTALVNPCKIHKFCLRVFNCV